MLKRSSFLIIILCIGLATSVVAAAGANDIFAKLPESFTFLSGAGGWSTDVRINADGTFVGLFEDWDMGGRGESNQDGTEYEYPNGTKYECYFSGSFTDVVQISEYEYSMRIASLITEGTEGEERIVDDALYITSHPYGFDNADEFRLYLPGRDTANLPQEYLSWVTGSLVTYKDDYAMPAALPCYGLYNVGGQQGFLDSATVFGTPSTSASNETPIVTPTLSSSHVIGSVTVAAGSVTMRNRPSEDGNTLRKMASGETYPCVGLDASGWYEVFAHDHIGYVPVGAVSFTASEAQPSHDRQVVSIVKITSNDFANIRATPNPDGEWLAGVSPGIALDCVDIAQNGWYCVVLPSGQTGYVSNKLCTPQ